MLSPLLFTAMPRALWKLLQTPSTRLSQWGAVQGDQEPWWAQHHGAAGAAHGIPGSPGVRSILHPPRATDTAQGQTHHFCYPTCELCSIPAHPGAQQGPGHKHWHIRLPKNPKTRGSCTTQEYETEAELLVTAEFLAHKHGKIRFNC